MKNFRSQELNKKEGNGQLWGVLTISLVVVCYEQLLNLIIVPWAFPTISNNIIYAVEGLSSI